MRSGDGRRSDLRPWTCWGLLLTASHRRSPWTICRARVLEQDDLRGDRIDDAVTGDLQSLRPDWTRVQLLPAFDDRASAAVVILVPSGLG